MFQRSNVVIDKRKSDSFVNFMRANAKNNDFWKEIKETASTKVNKDDLEKLFECK